MSLLSTLALPLLIPTHSFGRWLSALIQNLLGHLGISNGSFLEETIYCIIIVALAIALATLVRTITVIVVHKLLSHNNSDLVKTIIEKHLIHKSSHIITPLVMLALLPFAFATDPRTLNILMRIVTIYFLITLGWTICTVLSILWIYYDRHRNVKNLPLQGIVNLASGLVWIIIVIVAGSVVLDKSPAVLLTGLGAFAAALMLVFKDSILGFVAGLQLSANDMLRVGDWIVVPGTIANGIVIDVSLTAVKVRNWDNTTVTMPPYTLVSTSLQNYTKMIERGRRHIESSVLIDVNTVCPATPELVERLKKIPLLADYITTNQQWAETGQATSLARDNITVNGSIDTNLGLYRAYAALYLENHPWIAHGPTLMVYLEEPTAQGIPLTLFCYVNTVDWKKFEGIRSDIFEHLIAVAPVFGLSAFSTATGRDVVNIGRNDAQGLPYYGDTVPATPTPDPHSNDMIPPNTAGDPD